MLQNIKSQPVKHVYILKINITTLTAIFIDTLHQDQSAK